MSSRRVMVFGVFDNLHDGHRFFLREARKHGDNLIIVVARDSEVMAIKNQHPIFDADTRIRNLYDEKLADEVVLGDEERGTWKVIKKYRPDLIVLGYDQTSLEKSLIEVEIVKGISFVWVGPHEPHRFKSSLFRTTKPD